MPEKKGMAGLIVVVGSIVVIVATVVGAIALVFASMLLWAWALLLLWGWFIVPTFGVPVLTYPLAIGLSLTVSLFRRDSHIKSKYKDGAWSQVGYTIISPILTVLLGWLIHTYWM